MRWHWIDRFTEFIHGERATAVKNVTLAEEYLDEFSEDRPTLPASLIVEGMAQTGGLLVGEYNGFRERVVLAKLAKATFHDVAAPGCQLHYVAELQDIRADGAIVSGKVLVGDKLLAEIELVFAHLSEEVSDGPLFFPADFLRMLRVLQMYEIGRQPDGSRLEVPAHMLEAEAQQVGSTEAPSSSDASA